MNDKRINPADIPALFQRLGMRPVRNVWGDGRECGCVEFALAIDAHKAPLHDFFEAFCWASDEFGNMYAAGLRCGWDGQIEREDGDDASADSVARWQAGSNDGAEAARLVFGEGGT